MQWDSNGFAPDDAPPAAPRNIRNPLFVPASAPAAAPGFEHEPEYEPETERRRRGGNFSPERPRGAGPAGEVMRAGQEYEVAYELELWKAAEMAQFQVG